MDDQQENLYPLTIGLDIGIASVGWAVLGENRIINLGVRVFDKAETAKEGESLNLVRRTARLLRRRLRRRAWRLTKLSRLLKREGVIKDTQLFKTPYVAQKSLWQLRVDGLDRCLTNEEWARVLYHLCKHRGFHWVSRAEEKAAEDDSKGEGGKVKQGLTSTKKLMESKKYRSAAEMVLAEFPEAQRNKQGDYSKALSRMLLSEELALLFKKQCELGNTNAGAALEAAILGSGDKKSGLFWTQKPALSGKDLLKMLGHCTFEKEEYRAPKSSFIAERHVWLTRLNNLRIVVDGVTRSLTDQERALVLQLPYQQSSDLSYAKLGKVLIKAGYLVENSFKFVGLSYPSQRQKIEDKIKDPEAATLVKVPAWHVLKKTLKDAGLENEWECIANAALNGNSELLDQIAWILSIYKEDDEVTQELRKLSLPNSEKMVDALLNIRFDKFSNLSLKVLHKIVPHMEAGLRYDEACENAGYHHSQLSQVENTRQKYLPPFYSGREKNGRMVFNENMDIPRNPVVLRSLNQARKVVNALIKEYGLPHEVHIEMARDLSKSFDERRDIKTEQEKFRDQNKDDKDEFARQFDVVGTPKGGDFEKWRLYREQQGKCAYSIQPIDIYRLLEPGYVEIDHVLPYSRSFDDSKNNKVLVFTRENRNKGNKTPYEYLGGAENSEGWRLFVAFVDQTKAYRPAKRSRLLRKDFGGKEAEEFRDRNLNDTRYICRFFKNYVEQNLQLHEESNVKRCVVLSGQMTSFLRARWGLIKVRGDNDRHHALDAVIVAACNHSMVKRLSDYSRKKELQQVREGFVDMETGEIVNPTMHQQLQLHFPDPWQNFRSELQARLNIDDPEVLRTEIEHLGTYPQNVLESLRPLFVSRAPQRRNGGAVHKETIYGQRGNLKAQSVTKKVAVTALSLSDVDNLIDPKRNEKLYAAIRDWVVHRDEKEKYAKQIEASAGRGKDKRALTDAEKNEIALLRALPRKPDKEGNPTGPVVRSVTMVIDKLSGIPVRGGIAKNDSMLRVDVFVKKEKYFLVPVYVHHRVKGLPDRAIAANKDEKEWTLIDESFQFKLSLYPNDLVKISHKGKEEIIGYYAGCDRATASLSLWAHDRNKQVGKEGLVRGIGVKSALNIEKFHVDVLGNIYPATQEKCRDLA